MMIFHLPLTFSFMSIESQTKIEDLKFSFMYWFQDLLIIFQVLDQLFLIFNATNLNKNQVVQTIFNNLLCNTLQLHQQRNHEYQPRQIQSYCHSSLPFFYCLIKAFRHLSCPFSSIFSTLACTSSQGSLIQFCIYSKSSLFSRFIYIFSSISTQILVAFQIFFLY